MTDHEHVQLRTRTIGMIWPEADAEPGIHIAVDHVYLPEGSFPCGDCGEPGHDPGLVGLAIHGGEDSAKSALLTPEEALTLANRLQRAASLVYESMEDSADIEREAARFAAKDITP